MNQLDRPVWASLSTHHQHVAQGGPLAKRFLPDVNLFVAVPAESERSMAALAELIGPEDTAFVLQVPPIVVPAPLTAIKQAKGLQLVATRRFSGDTVPGDVDPLGEADAPDMLALAQLTEPGPFVAKTHQMGNFLGARVGGKLVAMAGERFRFPGHTEVSGVCTHPDHRGRGYARVLSVAVAAGIQARGDTVFLHAWKSNTAAISLYESLGFTVRTEVHVAILRRRSS